MNKVIRILSDKDPFISNNAGKDKDWRETGLWPCSWVSIPDGERRPLIAAYRLRFTLEQSVRFRAHVSGDERYALYLDGALVGRGPERGSPHHWFYESYAFELSAGAHVLVARVWSLGEQAAIATMSMRHGFLFAPEGEFTPILGTGHADWEAKAVSGYGFLDATPAFWREAPVQLDGSQYPWGIEQGDGEGWTPVQKLHPGIGRWVDWEFYRQHLLYPAMLPPQVNEVVSGMAVRHIDAPDSAKTETLAVSGSNSLNDEIAGWQALLQHQAAVTIPPNTRKRVVIDLNNYYCAYPEVVTSRGKGSLIRVRWAEALYEQPDIWRGGKGNRDEIEGKYCLGRRDVFLPDGGEQRSFMPLWWQAGRYVEIYVETADEALTLENFVLHETRYPLEMESQFTCSDQRLLDVMPILVRGMQEDAHETYADSPYYEELMYAGDTRLEVLMTYIMTRDDHLPRKAITMFDESRLPGGFTQARFPSRKPQVIAPFSIWWVGMVHDWALWRDDPAFVRAMLPGVRATLEGFARWIGEDGLLHAPFGWNTLDWVRDWPGGIPPGGVPGEDEVSGLLNWQLVYGLSLGAKLERWHGEPELAARYERWNSELVARLNHFFWDEARGLYADDLAHQYFSEHSQCMALLSGNVPDDRAAHILDALLTAPDLERATIYFSFYLFEVFQKYGRVDALFERMPLWFELVKNGLKCPVESPEPTRSDSHAWGAHPLYHYFATILGIRPDTIGFNTVVIRPQLGSLTHASGKLVHPLGGVIEVDLRVEQGQLRGSVALPEGVPGSFYDYAGQTIALAAGQTTEIG